MLNRWSAWLLPTVAGVGAVAAFLFVSSSQDEADPPAEMRAHQAAAPSPRLVPVAVDGDAGSGHRGRRLAVVSHERERHVDEMPEPHVDEPMNAERFEALRWEQRVRGQKMHREALAAHAREPIDPSWSREANWLLQDDLDAVAASTGTRIASIQCRSTSCSVGIEFRDYAHAHDAFANFAQGNYRVNCGRRISLFDERMGDVPFEAVLLLTCAGQADRGIAGP